MITTEQFKAIRSLSRLSQEDLAKAAGVSCNCLANFESGRTKIKAVTLKKLLDAMGVEIFYKKDQTTFKAS